MQRGTAASERFVEPTPKRHRAKERGHGMRMLAATTIETALEFNSRRGLIVGFGLEAIERPGHNPSSHLTKQCAQLTFKGHGALRCRLGLDKLVNEPSAPGERA
jgi:hypothetical protein